MKSKSGVIRLIALFKLFKALSLIVISVLSLKLMHSDIADTLAHAVANCASRGTINSPEYRRHLLDRFAFVDAARQVVGVGERRAMGRAARGRLKRSDLSCRIERGTLRCWLGGRRLCCPGRGGGNSVRRPV